MKNIRKKALYIINNVFYKGAFLNEELAILSNSRINKRDYNLIVNITSGVVQNKTLLDYIIGNYSKIKFHKIHKMILNILEIGVYQIFFTDRIPDYSIINESVNLAKIFGNKGSYGFVNAILRNILLNKEAIIESSFGLSDLKNTDFSKYLSIYYSHPEFYVNSLVKNHGHKFTEELLIANNSKPRFTVRVNTNKIELDGLVKELENLGFFVNTTMYSKYALDIKNPEGIFETYFFKKGYFYVQDEASILVAELSKIKSKSKILDLCSAPGGKSFNLAMLDKDSSIISCDLSDKKTTLIKSNVDRLGIKNIDIIRNDALKYNNTFSENFDFVLVDAPCSGLGLYRRKPEIKWNREYEDIIQLSKIQSKILDNASKYVKIGGNMVYSTCTITKEENDDVIKKFISQNKNFSIIEIEGKTILKFYPHIHNTDGFSVCKLKRMF